MAKPMFLKVMYYDEEKARERPTGELIPLGSIASLKIVSEEKAVLYYRTDDLEDPLGSLAISRNCLNRMEEAGLVV